MTASVSPGIEPFDSDAEYIDSILPEGEDAGIYLLIDEAVRDIDGWTT